MPATRSVALLRGINVGGHSKVPMAVLRAVVEELGGTDVVTYVNSGNVVYGGRIAKAALLDRIAEETGVRTHAVIVDAGTLDRIIEQMPFTREDPAKLGVYFLDSVPAQVDIPDGLEPEALALGELAVYHDLPDGFAGSKLKPAFWKQFPPEITARNWRTVLKLQELVRR